MRFVCLLLSSVFGLAACGAEPCNVYVSSIAIARNGASYSPSGDVCLQDNGVSMQFPINEDTLQSFSLDDATGGSFDSGTYDCSGDQIVAYLSDSGDPEPLDWARTEYEAGGSGAFDEASCSLEVVSDAAAGTKTGSFTGRLGRVHIDGETYEYVDVSFDFAPR
jgi:hypothetical protein